MSTADRRTVAFRKLEKAVRIVFRSEETGLSGLQHGRLAVDLRHLLARLKRLLREDPEDIFWDVLQQAILKTLKYMNRF